MDRKQAEILVRWARVRLLEGKSRAEVEGELDQRGIQNELRSDLLDLAERGIESARKMKRSVLRDGTGNQILIGIGILLIATILYIFAWPESGRGRGVIISTFVMGIAFIGNAIYWRIEADK